ncbi:hypothetical protein ALC56_13579, partial [Trachymyrmex septentrionalis]
NVFSCSECPPKFRPPLFRPTASISSINNIHGACFRAMENISRTLEGPTPTNISKNSEPDTVIKGTFASPAVALANKVLPVPGGPIKNTTYMYGTYNIFKFYRYVRVLVRVGSKNTFYYLMNNIYFIQHIFR